MIVFLDLVGVGGVGRVPAPELCRAHMGRHGDYWRVTTVFAYLLCQAKLFREEGEIVPCRSDSKYGA